MVVLMVVATVVLMVEQKAASRVVKMAVWMVDHWVEKRVAM